MKKDIIAKEVIEELIRIIAQKILGFSFKKIKFLNTEMQRVESRRADVVALIDNEFVLHLEIQNQNDLKMPYRMLRYWLDIKQIVPNKTIEQFVIYIGKDKVRMSDKLSEKGLFYSYNIIDMKQIDCQYFIKDDTPEGLVLSILCDFKNNNPKDLVKYIIDRLVELSKNENEFRKYMLMLEELSTNRDLKKIVKEMEMLSEIKWEELPSYEIGLERGIERGREEGREEGIHQGIILAYDFGIDIKTIANRYDIEEEVIENIIKSYKGQ